MWGKFLTQISEFEQVNQAARWDYQRDRVYVRSSRRIRKIAAAKIARRKNMSGFAKWWFVPTRLCAPIAALKGIAISMSQP